MAWLFDERLPPRFWKRVALEGDYECWMWIGARRAAGYGQFWDGRTMAGAHRVAFANLRGPIPAGLELDHLCRNRWCVNPDHLEPVTHQENMYRSDAGEHLAAANLAKTHCPQGHAYDERNTYVMPSTGSRFCRECARLYQSAVRDRRRAAAGKQKRPPSSEIVACPQGHASASPKGIEP